MSIWSGLSQITALGSRVRLIALKAKAREVSRIADGITGWSDRQLLSTAQELRWRARTGVRLSSLLPGAFALVQESAYRTWGLRYFSVQICAGLVLAEGGVAEMETGEGKTLSALLPVFLRALPGHGCHVLTTNDYLAKRDHLFAAPVLARLGLSVGFLENSMTADFRRRAYACDVTYGTEKEMGFDFLRDRLLNEVGRAQHLGSKQEPVQRGHYSALVDEADSVMIDQARTPLLIAVNRKCSPGTISMLKWSDSVAGRLKENTDYHYQQDRRAALLTNSGYRHVLLESKPHLVASYDTEMICRQVERALTARLGFSAQRDYVVIDGKVQIVDESTGRILEGRRWQDRLHQAIEVREQLPVSNMTHETARISVQSYLNLYKHRAGMTGTAFSVGHELKKVYGVRVTRIPVHQPCQRRGLTPRIFLTMRDKLNAVVADIAKRQQQGRAVLVGTPSVRASELLSAALRDGNITHQLLHARQDHREATIIAGAGQSSSVVVATNMAGRGTDIQISEAVRRTGGLHVIATEMHSSERIDRQLIGRAARRGDPGSFQFLLSFEDDLLLTLPQAELEGLRHRCNCDQSGELSASQITVFEMARRRLELCHEAERRRMLQSEKRMREICEKIGLDPWLESFEMNQTDG